jgi:hypothetical protein
MKSGEKRINLAPARCDSDERRRRRSTDGPSGAPPASFGNIHQTSTLQIDDQTDCVIMTMIIFSSASFSATILPAARLGAVVRVPLWPPPPPSQAGRYSNTLTHSHASCPAARQSAIGEHIFGFGSARKPPLCKQTHRRPLRRRRRGQFKWPAGRQAARLAGRAKATLGEQDEPSRAGATTDAGRRHNRALARPFIKSAGRPLVALHSSGHSSFRLLASAAAARARGARQTSGANVELESGLCPSGCGCLASERERPVRWHCLFCLFRSSDDSSSSSSPPAVVLVVFVFVLVFGGGGSGATLWPPTPTLGRSLWRAPLYRHKNGIASERRPAAAATRSNS